MSKKVINLYTTSGCHLCEQAESMIFYLINNDGEFDNYDLQKVEISESEKLLGLYGVKIPVLSLMEKELNWPFSFDELKNWLISNN